MRPDPVADELARTKSRLLKSTEERTNKPAGFLDARPHKVSPRWPYACARIQRILEGAQPARGHSFESACKTAAYPRLAQDFMELYSYYLTRDKPAPIVGTDHNPFRLMSGRDAVAKFQVLVEKICDRSTAKMGGWYVGISATGAARNRG